MKKFKSILKSPGQSAGSSDGWIRRIFRRMTRPKHLKQMQVHPCFINGKETLIHEKGLAENDPAAYAGLQQYAEQNDYVLKEDQRADFIEGVRRVKDPLRANVMTIMVVAASFMTTAASASIDDDITDLSALDTDITISNLALHQGMGMEGISHSDDMVADLFDWINDHTSFDHSIDEMPTLSKVSAEKMAEVAFGGKLPAAIDVHSLNILGLYNFHEKTIYIVDSLDLETEKGKAVLLHELVHFVQYETGQQDNVQCKNELESLAYKLEARYLTDHGHGHGISQAHVDRASSCRS